MAKQFILALTLLGMLLAPAVTVVEAQAPEPECDLVYTVQAGDWLSKIAEKYLGDVLAYDQLVELANASGDDEFSDIENPDLIEPGMQLCIPAVDVIARLAGIAAEAPAGLSPQELANATYPNSFVASGTVTLQAGRYGEAAAPGSASMVTVRLMPVGAYGTINGQPVAAVVLATNSGGSGTFYELYLMASQNGQPTSLGHTSLGDRIEINSITIQNDQVLVDMIQAGPDDPLCCPSQQVIKTYELQGDLLVEVSSQPMEGSTETGAEATLVGPVWQWQQTAMNDGTTRIPDNPANYTIQFSTEGQVSIKADCNQVGGEYTSDGSSVSIQLGPSTMAMCPPESLSDVYLADLSAVALYFFEDGELVLELMADSGTMKFSHPEAIDGGAAATPTQVIPFDPSAIQIDSSREPLAATCEASAEVPGAYACTTAAGGNLNPCFVLDGPSLMCNPTPAFGNYSSLVVATNALPTVPAPMQTPFSLMLEGNNPPCNLRTIQAYAINGQPVTYNCEAPGAWIVNELDRSQPTWVAQYVITNPSDGSVASGPMPTNVATAWVY